jgi:hypothetical protein
MSYYGTEREIIENLEKKITYWQDLAVANRKVAEGAQAQRDKALVALNSIKEYWNGDRNEKDMFYACQYAVNTADEVLKECWKPKVEK